MHVLLSTQKYILLAIFGAMNALLCFNFGFHPNQWYAFLFVLGLGTFLHCFSVIAIMLNSIKNVPLPERTEARKYLYLVPCYNESMKELSGTLNSLTSQYRRQNLTDDVRMVIVCDGKVRKNMEEESTDSILKQIFKIDISSHGTADRYKSIANTSVVIEIHSGEYNNTKFMLIIKDHNQGKRDSITLVRRLCLGVSRYISPGLMHRFKEWAGPGPIDYIIGVDADTIFDPMCTEELIKGIEAGGDDCKGCVGFVDIPRKFNLFVLYQYAEYHYGQLLRRRAQSETTHKVNCLSGCNQIIRVCNETCGDELMKRYTRIPDDTESIFSHIRSYASEDRNHVCLMLSMYPWVKTVQNIRAIAYTDVPESMHVFLSQRRRWTLGALTNDMLLTYLPNIHILERITAIVNIVTFSFNPFIVSATGFFLRALITSADRLMLYISIPMIIPFAYILLAVPGVRGFYPSETLYFYVSYLSYLILGIPASLLIYVYALLGMDTIKWGKTRQAITAQTAETHLTIEKLPVPIVEKLPVTIPDQASTSSSSSSSITRTSSMPSLEGDDDPFMYVDLYVKYGNETFV